MKITKVFKNKKGAALEMAILFMVIVFCFCTLLTTMTLTARSRIKLEKVYFNLDLDNDPNADEIVEDCLEFMFMIASINRNQDRTLFVETENGNLKNIPEKDNVAQAFTSYITGKYGEIPSKYAGYTRQCVDPSVNMTVINIVTNATITDIKTLKCIVILDNIRIDVEYTIDEGGTVIQTVKQIVK